MIGARLLCALCALLGSSCSLILGWDNSGLPCEQNPTTGNYECFDGYSCAFLRSAPLSPVCVADHSLHSGDACKLDRQCPASYVCPTAIGTCTPACDPNFAFGTGPGCGGNTYCAPALSIGMYSGAQIDGEAVPVPTLVGGCVPSDACTPGSACVGSSGTVQGGICVTVSAAATACVPGCEPQPQVGAGGKPYFDQCGTNYVCQPVGMAGTEQFVCLDSVPPQANASTTVSGMLLPAGTTQPLKGPCSPAAFPCAKGAVCVAGTCRSYCVATAPPTSGSCTGNDVCCALGGLAAAAAGTTANQGQVGYCSASAACQ